MRKTTKVIIMKMRSIRILKIMMFVIFQSFILCNCSFAESVDTTNLYKVIDIKKSKKSINGTNKAYIILLQELNTDRIITLVSVKSKNITGRKIKKGKTYMFYLEKYYEMDWVIHLGVKLSVKDKGVKIHIPMSFYTSNIYTVSNLNGLYYQIYP